MKVIEIKLNDKTDRQLIFDVKEDNCPICEQPLKDAVFSWNIFHGEASSSCCKTPYQTKDYYVDDDKKDAYKEYFAEINKPGKISISIKEDYIQDVNEALKQTGLSDIRLDEVYELSTKLHNERLGT